MSSERPKRSRKVVNYGEDHLHWVEESQLQKALLRSLADKGSPSKKDTVDNKVPAKKVKRSEETTKAKSLFGKNKSAAVNEHQESDYNSDSEADSVVCKTSSSFPDDTCVIRLTRLQSKLLEAAGMLEPTTDVDHFSTTQNDAEELEGSAFDNSSAEANEEESDIEESTLASRVRAQRKFASNASPTSSASNSPVKMHKRKVNPANFPRKHRHKQKNSASERAVRASTSSITDIVEMNVDKSNRKKQSAVRSLKSDNRKHGSLIFEGLPKTDAFLDYLCFRNTTVKVELHDCIKH